MSTLTKKRIVKKKTASRKRQGEKKRARTKQVRAKGSIYPIINLANDHWTIGFHETDDEKSYREIKLADADVADFERLYQCIIRGFPHLKQIPDVRVKGMPEDVPFKPWTERRWNVFNWWELMQDKVGREWMEMQLRMHMELYDKYLRRGLEPKEAAAAAKRELSSAPSAGPQSESDE